jgi:hypothetical protein
VAHRASLPVENLLEVPGSAASLNQTASTWVDPGSTPIDPARVQFGVLDFYVQTKAVLPPPPVFPLHPVAVWRRHGSPSLGSIE